MREILTDLVTKVAPAHTALLVVDMQNDFCAQGGYINRVKNKDVSASAAVAESINGVLESARQAGVLVVWIRAIYDPKYLVSPMLAKQQELGISEGLCAEGSWGADFFGVQPAADEFILDKHRYSAFSGTKLDNLLREHGVRTLVLTGVATNVCIESTLRDGFMNGYYIVVPEDCVGSHSQDLHEATLKNVRLTFGDVPQGAELSKLWAADGALQAAG